MIAIQILIALVVIFLLIRRHLETRIISKRMLIEPLIFLVFGVFVSLRISSMDAGGWTFLILGAAIGIPIGVWQGHLTQVFQENGVWVSKGRIIGIAVWLMCMPVRFGLRYALTFVIPTHASFTGWHAVIPFLFPIAGIVAGRLLGIYMKHPQVRQQPAA